MGGVTGQIEYINFFEKHKQKLQGKESEQQKHGESSKNGEAPKSGEEGFLRNYQMRKKGEAEQPPQQQPKAGSKDLFRNDWSSQIVPNFYKRGDEGTRGDDQVQNLLANFKMQNQMRRPDGQILDMFHGKLGEKSLNK